MTDPLLSSKTATLYATRDHYALSPQFERHMLALTAEGLESKSAIAAELAFRDIEIERLMHHVRASPSLSNQYVQLAETEIAAQRRACEELRAAAGNKQKQSETNGQQIAAYELLAAALAELPDPDFVPEEEREDRLRRLRERIDAHLAVTDYMALRDADALPTYIHVGNVFRTDEEGDVLVDWDSEAYEPKVGTLLFVRLWTQAEIDTARKAGAVKANEEQS